MSIIIERKRSQKTDLKYILFLKLYLNKVNCILIELKDDNFLKLTFFNKILKTYIILLYKH